MRNSIQTEYAPSPVGAYSQGVKSPSNTLYVSAQMPMDPTTGKIPLSIEDQTHQVLKNIENILFAGELTMENVMRVTVYLTSDENFKRFNSVYKDYFTEPYPARRVIVCPLDGELIEMDIIAE